jgi:hypothetical protein
MQSCSWTGWTRQPRRPRRSLPACRTRRSSFSPAARRLSLAPITETLKHCVCVCLQAAPWALQMEHFYSEDLAGEQSGRRKKPHGKRGALWGIPDSESSESRRFAAGRPTVSSAAAPVFPHCPPLAALISSALPPSPPVRPRGLGHNPDQ